MSLPDKLIYYELYQEFHEMFDGQLEIFCSKKSMTQSEFMTRCRAAREEDPKAKHYIDILLSSVEYETFVKLMRIMRPVAEHRLAQGDRAEAKGVAANSSGNARRAGDGDGNPDEGGSDIEGAKSPGGSSKYAAGHKRTDDADDDGFGSPDRERDRGRYSAAAKEGAGDDTDQEQVSPSHRAQGRARGDVDADADAKGDRSRYNEGNSKESVK
jgi:The ARF-like 2 binding protein BART